MEVDKGRHNRLPADVLHIGVFGDGDGPCFSRGDDMIAFDDQHGVLDCRPACSINQARAFKHDLSRLGLSAGARASRQHAQKNAQDHPSVRTIYRFHFVPPRKHGILVQVDARVKHSCGDRCIFPASPSRRTEMLVRNPWRYTTLKDKERQ